MSKPRIKTPDKFLPKWQPTNTQDITFKLQQSEKNYFTGQFKARTTLSPSPTLMTPLPSLSVAPIKNQPITIIEAFDRTPITSSVQSNTNALQTFTKLAVEAQLHIVESKLPHAVGKAVPLVHIAVEGVESSHKRIELALQNGKSKTEAYTCGTLGGFADAAGSHGAFVLAAKATTAATSVSGPIVGGTIGIGTYFIAKKYAEMGGDAVQAGCHKLAEKIEASSFHLRKY